MTGRRPGSSGTPGRWSIGTCPNATRCCVADWEADDPRQGTRSFIRVLRLLEKFSLVQLAAAVEYALDIDVIDADSIRTIVEHRSDQPVELFPLDGRPHLAHVRVESTDVSSYQALLGEATP